MGVESRQDLGGALDWMVGPTSIVRAVRTILNAPGEPRLFSVASVPNSLTSIAGAEMAGHTGAMAETWEQAAASAIGECVERYCCAVQPPNLLTAPARQLGEGALLVDDFELFDERQYAHPQFPFARHTEDLPMTWVPAARIRDGEPRFVPACLVYIPYVPRLVEHSDMVALSVSSGQACHSDADLALLSGLYEVIERDAFMLTWVRRLPPTRLNYRDDPVVGPWFDRYFADSSLTFDVFRLRSDIAVPSVLCVARGIHHQGPFACVGASCRLDESEAVRKAIVEAAQGAVWVRDLIDTKPHWEHGPDYANVRDFEDHVRLYGDPGMLEHLDFLYVDEWDGLAPAPTVTGLRAQREQVLDCLEAVGLQALVVDITTRDVADAGLVVLRVLIPGSVQLYSVHGLPNFGARRYHTVPPRLGFDADIHRSYNPVPHPFP